MAVSANGTYNVGPGAAVTDAYGKVYAINNFGQVTIDGHVDLTTSRVDGLGYSNGHVWQKIGNNQWYSKTSPTAAWVGFPSAYGPAMAVSASANYTFNKPAAYSATDVSSNNANQIFDTNANLWTINLAGQVVIDGRIDVTTAHVVQMALVNGVISQENASGNWYSKVKPSDTWSSAVRRDPILAAQAVAQTWIGDKGGNNPMLGSNWSRGQAPTPHQNLSISYGTINLGGGNLAGNTLTISGQPYQPTGLSGYEAIAPIINMTAGGSLNLDFVQHGTSAVKVNVMSGQAALTISSPASSTSDVIITLGKLSSVLLHANMAFGSLTETGGTVLLNGDSHLGGATVLLNSDLAGNGLLAMGTAHSSRPSLEVTGSIGAGVTIAITGDVRHGAGLVVLDHAGLDHGTITLQDSFLELRGAGAVDSASYKNSMLTLYHGNTVLEAINVVGVANPYGFGGNGILHFAKNAAGNILAYNGVGQGAPPAGLITLASHI